MHYGVEVVRDQAGAQFQQWIGGYYENSFSCKPIWEPKFDNLPEHPITRGVKPFQVKDEWYSTCGSSMICLATQLRIGPE